MHTRPVAVLLALAATAVAAPTAGATATGDDGSYISFSATPGGFPLVADGTAAPIVVSSADHPGVVRVVDDLQADVERVTGVKPAVATDDVPAQSDVVLVGTVGRSPLIDQLVHAGKLDVSAIAGKWETSLEQVVDDPMPGVRRAFVIAGSDQRGTIFGATTSPRASASPPGTGGTTSPPPTRRRSTWSPALTRRARRRSSTAASSSTTRTRPPAPGRRSTSGRARRPVTPAG